MMTAAPSRVLDLCAGPGGWSTALASLGLAEIGIELDAVACATRRAAGHATIRADIASLPVTHLAGKLLGLLASPPCQGMSRGGLRAGWADLDLIRQLLADLAAGRDTRAAFAETVNDPRSLLIAEPLRYALAARPEWVVCEQVPAVLPLWQDTARHLDRADSTWTGTLNAADHGAPQSRRRAILIASRVRAVHTPAPTHAQHADTALPLYGPTRAGWVSMADALDLSGNLIVNTRGRHVGGGCDFPTSGPSWALTKSARSWLLLDPDHRPAAPGIDTGRLLTVPQASTLQGFPPHYPWAGSRTKVFEQIGNAVPPPLARAVLAAATGIEVGA